MKNTAMEIKYPKLMSGIIASGVNAYPNGIKSGWLLLFKIFNFLTKSPMYKLMLSEPDITAELLSEIQIPVSIIGGSRDMIKINHMKWIADNIPNGRFTILDGETHGSYVIDNAKLADVIIEAVSSQDISVFKYPHEA